VPGREASVYVTAVLLHVLGAAIWVGGHVVLVTIILPQALARRDPAFLLQFESRFERIGIPSLLVQVATGFWLATQWVPDFGEWLRFGSGAAALVGLKLLLLAATVVLAGVARFGIIPRLTAANLPRLSWYVIAVTVISILFVTAGVALRTGVSLVD
jgi:putative copper export protein